MLKSKWMRIGLVTVMTSLSIGATIAEAAGVLTIGRREDSTTFDPIKTAQNIDLWVFANVYDVLIRVDKTGTKLEPGLAESWGVSPDGLSYTLKLRDAKFSDGSALTAEDVVFSLTPYPRRRGIALGRSLQGDGDRRGDRPEDRHDQAEAADRAVPGHARLPDRLDPLQEGFETLGAGEVCRDPDRVGRLRHHRVAARRPRHPRQEPAFREADRVSLDGIEWISVPDDNTRMLNVQAGQLDTAIFVPFSRVARRRTEPYRPSDPSTREDHLLINHEKGALAKKEVRQALDMAIDEQAVVDTVTFGYGEVANSYVPKGALYYYADNLKRKGRDSLPSHPES